MSPLPIEKPRKSPQYKKILIYKNSSNCIELMFLFYLFICIFPSRANKTIDSLQKGRESEVAQLQAMLKKTEMRVNTLERIVDQKTQENNELTSICDELITKVGK